MSMSRAMLAGFVAFLIGFGSSSAQTVQEERPGIRPSGANVQLGYVDPDGTSSAFQLGGELGLGSVFKPWLRFSAGVTYWSAELDPQEGRPGLTGDLRDFQINTRLRWDLVDAQLVPFAFTGLSLHLLSADIPGDPVLQDALSDFQPGFDLGFGLGYMWNQWRFSSEYRKQFVEDVDNWSWTAGVAWWARRPATQIVGYATPPAVQPARSVQVPVSRQTVSQQPATPASEVIELKQLLRDVLEENRLMQVELQTLRQRAQRASTDETASDKRVEELQVALQQLGDLSGQVDALRRSQDGLLFMLPGSILFATGSARLEVGALEELRRLTSVLLRFPDFDAIVEGHTDSMGDAERNRSLSQARAESVMTELIRLGVNPSRMRAVGMGADRPVADNSQAEGRARNRRVDIRFVHRAQEGLG